jgi:hypothetical protein
MVSREHLTAEERERIYQNAITLMEGKLFSEAADELSRIPDYKDAAKRIEECRERSDDSHLDAIYEDADKAAANRNVRSQEKAIRIFSRISGYRDADERIEQAKNAIEEIRQQERKEREEKIAAAEKAKEKARKRKKLIIRLAIIAAAVAAVCVAGVLLFKKYAVPLIRYNRGVQQMEAGAYDEAYSTLHELNYKDSSERIRTIAKEWLKDAEIGSIVRFGAYPKGEITSKEKSPIEWIVLDKDGSRMLLITRYAVDALPFMRYDYSADTHVDWETCLPRNWLNSEFLNVAFDSGEQQMIERTRLTTEGASGGQFTIDRVFLLSVSEVESYFATDEARKCVATQYARGFGAYRSSIDETCLWWLRTPADAVNIAEQLDGEISKDMRVFCIGTSGQIVGVGHEILNAYGVRPAVWVDLDGTG